MCFPITLWTRSGDKMAMRHSELKTIFEAPPTPRPLAIRPRPLLRLPPKRGARHVLSLRHSSPPSTAGSSGESLWRPSRAPKPSKRDPAQVTSARARRSGRDATRSGPFPPFDDDLADWADWAARDVRPIRDENNKRATGPHGRPPRPRPLSRPRARALLAWLARDLRAPAHNRRLVKAWRGRG